MAAHPLLDHPTLRYLREDVSLLDADGHILGTTMEHGVTIGYAPDVWRGTPFFAFLDRRDQDEIRRAWDRFVATPGDTRTCEVRLRSADGLPNLVELDLRNHLDDPDWHAVVAITRNVTRVRAAEVQLDHHHELIDKICRGDSDDALADIADSVVRQVGRARVAIASVDERGVRRIEVGRGIGAATAELLLDGVDRTDHADVRGVVVFEPAVSARTGRTLGGVLVVLDEPRALLDHERRALTGAGKFVASVVELRWQEEQRAYREHYDELTGALNRSHLRERITQGLRRRDASIAVLLVDIDRFQLVNDGYGHAVGDQLLRAFAGRLRRFLDTDDLLARLGGDEFVVLIQQRHTTDAAEVVAERITRALADPFAVGGKELHVTAGIGIARTRSGDCDSVDQLLAEADAALAESKQRARGAVTVYSADTHDRMIRRLEREDDLRRALRHDELVVHYQPTFDLSSDRLVAAEALVRWQHPRDGLLLPGAFVPLAEDAGLVGPLGAHVLDQAVAQAARWAADGVVAPGFAIAVNVAAGQIAAEGFTEVVRDALQRHGWDPRHLVLELTESSLMIESDVARRQLADLEALGVKLAIDDFGTGYSSLSYLHRFAVDVVKLDQSLVQALDDHDQAPAVALAVATIAHSLDLISVAEGIETDEQLAMARSLGFDWGQGHRLGEPVPADELRDRLG